MSDQRINSITEAARTLLVVLDGWGDGNTHDDWQRLVLASCFGAEAFDIAANAPMTADTAPTQMVRAFLQAIIDPNDPALDYLRACSQPAAQETIQ